jgi:hypothetical protein
MIFSNKTYDILVWITTIVLPAIGTLYFALSGIWGFPYGEQVVGTITAIVTFLGVILRISNVQYNKPADVDVSGLQYLEDGDEDELA